jgi:hemoglobin
LLPRTLIAAADFCRWWLPEVLGEDGEFKFEILAIEESGNQTIKATSKPSNHKPRPLLLGLPSRITLMRGQREPRSRIREEFYATASHSSYNTNIGKNEPNQLGGIMDRRNNSRWILGLAVVAMLVTGTAVANDSVTVTEQVAGLQQMCADTAEARAQRQAEQPLYERLGGYDKIHEFTREVVRLHFENDSLDRIMEGVDGERLAKSVADFTASGTGGPKVYKGRTMPEAHARLELTDADFLAAGGDIVTAMQTMGYGQNEIDEFVCILVSLKDQVVFK